MAVETIRTAWVGLASHRMRTALTVLGITIGIASVIVLIAVGCGIAIGFLWLTDDRFIPLRSRSR